MSVYSRAFLLFGMLYLFLAGIVGCGRPDHSTTGEEYFRDLAKTCNCDTFANYPYGDPDSCLVRIKHEFPPQYQAYACLSVWYHLPRIHPYRAFRLLDLYEQNYPHDTVHAFAQICRAEYYTEMAKFDSAQACLADARKLYHKLQRPLDESDADYLLGRIYTYQNNFPKAIETYYALMDLLNSQDTALTERHANLYLDLSVAYERSNDHQQEKRWLLKCWNSDLRKLAKPLIFKIKVAKNLSCSYHHLDPDSSIYWAQTAVNLFHQVSPKPVPAELLYWLGRAYEVNNRCPEALPYFLEAFRTNKNKHESFEYYQYRQALGECYSCLGRLDSAEFYIRQALESPDTGNLSVAHIMLADIAKKRGDFSAAYQEEAEGLRLFKIKFTSEKAAATAEFEARYESVQKENRISSLEKQSLIERQRFQIGILYLLLAFGLVFMLFIRQRMLHQKTKQSRMLAEQAKELAEARALAHLVDLEDTKADLKTTRQDLEHNKRLLELKNLLVDDLQIRLSLPEQQAADRINTATFKILTDSDWRQFRQQFERKFPGFQDNLNGRYPALTSSESRLFLLIKLGFSTKEIADILGIAQESVWRNRHRLASKLELGNTNDLESFVERFNQGSAEEERDGVTA